MGWFDKKSWRLRRKIKDLQADLREAEKEGRYILQDGLFFAELEDMGEMTMLVFGASDLLSAQEEGVIRTFFDRNGFTVHRLKIDRDQSHLAEVEILPPSEMVRHVARQLKAHGFKVLDDTAQETAPQLDKHIVTLSALVRALVILFAERVRNIIATTRIKMNKEGNRLLHWMPKIVEALRPKVPRELVELVRTPFELAYEEYFGHLGSSAADRPSASAIPDRIPSIQFRPVARENQDVQGEASPPRESPPLVKSTPPVAPIKICPETIADSVRAEPPKATTESDQIEIQRLLKESDAAEALARMYKKLVRAQSSRCVRNAEALLEEVVRLFRATAACILVKVPHARGITIHAQSGKRLVWGEGGKDGFPVSTSVVAEVIRTRQAARSDLSSAPATESMIFHNIEAVAAAPIFSDGEIVGILYVDRREGLQPFDVHDVRILERLAKVFEEFPDLTLGLL